MLLMVIYNSSWNFAIARNPRNPRILRNPAHSAKYRKNPHTIQYVFQETDFFSLKIGEL